MEVNTNDQGILGKYQEVFSNLTKDQLRLVVAMQEYSSKKDAAESLGISAKTAYNWGSVIDEAVKLLTLDIVESAKQMRKSALARAIAVKIAGLDSTDEKVRQAAASEIIEWELGKAKQALEHTGEGGKPIEIIEVVKHGGTVQED